MNTNTALKLLAIVLLLGLGYFLVVGRGGDAGVSGEPVEEAGPVEAVRSTELVPVEDVEPSGNAPAERVEATDSSVAAASAPWEGELAGLSGRVVETGGTPVVGIRVALLELDTEVLFAGGIRESVSKGGKEPSLELEETITDREGRFLLGGARAPAFHGLGIDLGGPRATVRVLDTALVHRERTDVGDVVLAPYGVLTGRIVGENGAGISGARIRVGPFPEELLMGAPYEVRADSLFGVSMLLDSGNGRGVIELPRWVHALVDDLPVSTTTSDEKGSFRLEGVPLAQVLGGVDKPGFAGIPVGPIDMNSARGAGEHDLGNLVLSRGRTIEGYVEDSEGDPVVGVEVFAGAEVPAGFVAILQPCGKSDDEGRFMLRGVSAEGRVVAATRRSRSEPWAGAVTTEYDDVFLPLESTIELFVRVQDEGREPLSGAHIALEPRHEEDMMGLGEALRFLPSEIEPHRSFLAAAPGTYVASITPGDYDVTVHVEGRALGKVSAELWDDPSEVVVTCPTGRHVAVTVVDAATREPVGGARARVMVAGYQGFVRLASGVSGAEGRVRLGPFGEQNAQGVRGETDQTILAVRHPRYADHSTVLEPGARTVVVALESGGVLAGRVHLDGEIPTRTYMLTLEYRGAPGFLEVFHMPRFGLSDLAGAFRLEDLAAGEYRVELHERFLDQDPLRILIDKLEATTVHSEAVTIVSGQTTELVINLTSSGRGPTARIKGRVRVNGHEMEGAEVTVSGRGSSQVTTDTWGRFDTEEFPVADGVSITIWGEVGMPSGSTSNMLIHTDFLELQAGEVREIDVDLVPVEVLVQVVDGATGDPIADAQVEAAEHADELTTDAAGRVSVWVVQPGDHELSAHAAGFSRARRQAVIPETGQAELRLELLRSVPCAGRVAIPSHSPAGGSFSYIMVRGEEDAHTSAAMIYGPDYEFALADLPEGAYRAWIIIDGVEGREASFELGPHGDRDLVLDFVPKED